MVSRSEKKLYSFASFLRASSYFLRLILVVIPWLTKVVVIVPSDPPPSAAIFAEVITNHMVDNHECFKKAYDENTSSETFEKQRLRYQNLWITFFGLFNGSFWIHQNAPDDLVIYHHSSKRLDRI